MRPLQTVILSAAAASEISSLAPIAYQSLRFGSLTVAVGGVWRRFRNLDWGNIPVLTGPDHCSQGPRVALLGATAGDMAKSNGKPTCYVALSFCDYNINYIGLTH